MNNLDPNDPNNLNNQKQQINNNPQSPQSVAPQTPVQPTQPQQAPDPSFTGGNFNPPTPQKPNKLKWIIPVVVVAVLVLGAGSGWLLFNKLNKSAILTGIKDQSEIKSEEKGVDDPYDLVQKYYDYARGDSWDNFQALFHPNYRDNLYGFILIADTFQKEKADDFVSKEDFRFGIYSEGGDPIDFGSHYGEHWANKKSPLAYEKKATEEAISCKNGKDATDKAIVVCKIPLLEKHLAINKRDGSNGYSLSNVSFYLIKDDYGWWMTPSAFTDLYKINNEEQLDNFFPLDGMGKQVNLLPRTDKSVWSLDIDGGNSFKEGSPNYIINLLTKNITKPSDEIYKIMSPYLTATDYGTMSWLSMHLAFTQTTKMTKINDSSTMTFKAEDGNVYYWVSTKLLNEKQEVVMITSEYVFLKDVAGKWYLTEIGTTTSILDTLIIKGSIIPSDYPKD